MSDCEPKVSGLVPDPYGATVPPLYQTATFVQRGVGITGSFDYSRSGNPTRASLERQIADLEGGCLGLAYGSGMAAISGICRLLRPGDVVLAGDDLYGGTCRFLSQIQGPLGIDIRYVDTTSLAKIEEALDERVRMLFVETPSNPFLKISDIAGIAGLLAEAQHRFSWVQRPYFVVDNTLMTPLLQRPLSLGADIVIHSGTKFLNGHSDVSAGFAVTSDVVIGESLAFFQNAEGNALSPFDAWLTTRGLKTLSLRLARQQENVQLLADWLEAHPLVERVFSPASAGHEGAALHFRQCLGVGGVLSIALSSAALAQRLVANTQVFQTAVSFGSVTSSICLPSTMSHASIPGALETKEQIPGCLVRLSMGIEDAGVLRRDLEAVLGDIRSVCVASQPRKWSGA